MKIKFNGTNFHQKAKFTQNTHTNIFFFFFVFINENYQKLNILNVEVLNLQKKIKTKQKNDENRVICSLDLDILF